jgi:hypothetical protein
MIRMVVVVVVPPFPALVLPPQSFRCKRIKMVHGRG